jgi:hypothetical protein
VGADVLYALAAFLTASAAAAAVRELRACKREIHASLADLGKFTAPIAEKGGMGRPAMDAKSAIAKILDTAERFEIPGLFIRFLQECALLISAWLRKGDGAACVDTVVTDSAGEKTNGTAVSDGTSGIEKTVCAGLWRRELERARVENNTYNISPPLALERLFEALKTGMVCGR